MPILPHKPYEGIAMNEMYQYILGAGPKPEPLKD